MKKLKYYLVLLVVLVSSTGCYAENHIKQAWWLTIDIPSKETDLDGLSLSAFNSQWKYAVFLENQIIKKKINNADYQKFLSSNFTFKKELDLNGNGISEVFRVGVYVDQDQHNGIFLAIYENNKIIKVMSDSSHQNFSVLLESENQLLWYKCMECGDFEKLVWSGTSYFLE